MAKRAVKESDNGIEKEDSVTAAKSGTDSVARKDTITGKRAIKKALKGLYGHDIESEHDGGTITLYTVEHDSDGHGRRSDEVSFDIEELRSTVPHFVEMLGSPDAFCMLAEELGIDGGYARIDGGTEDDGYEIVASIKPYSGTMLVKSLEFPISTYDGTLTFNGDDFIVWEEPERCGIGSGNAGERTGRYIRVVGDIVPQSDVPAGATAESAMATPRLDGRTCMHITIGFADAPYELDTNIPPSLSRDIDRLKLVNARPANDPRNGCESIVDAYAFIDGASATMYDCLQTMPKACMAVMCGIESHENGYAGDTSDAPLQLAAARHGLNVLADKGNKSEYMEAESRRISMEIAESAADGPIHINEDGEREFASSAMCEIGIGGGDRRTPVIAACVEGGGIRTVETFDTKHQLSEAIREYISLDDDGDSMDSRVMDGRYDDFVASVEDVSGDILESDAETIRRELRIGENEKIFVYSADLSDVSLDDIDETLGRIVSGKGNGDAMEGADGVLGFDDDGNLTITFGEGGDPDDIDFDIDDMTMWGGYVVSVGRPLDGSELADAIAEAAFGTTSCFTSDELLTTYNECFGFDDELDWDDSWEFNVREPRYHIQGDTPRWFIDFIDLTNAFSRDGDIVDREYSFGELDDGIAVAMKPICANFGYLDGLLGAMPGENDFELMPDGWYVFSKKIPTRPGFPLNGASYEVAIGHGKGLKRNLADEIDGETLDSYGDCWWAYIGIANYPYPVTQSWASRHKVRPALSVGILIPDGYEGPDFLMGDCYDVLRTAVTEVVRRIRDDEMIYEDCDACSTQEGCPHRGERHGERDRVAVKAACGPVIANMLALRNPRDDFQRMLDEL